MNYIKSMINSNNNLELGLDIGYLKVTLFKALKSKDDIFC